MAKYRLAAQLYTVRNFTQNPEDFKATMKRLKKIGYDYAQISGIGPMAPKDVRAMMMDAGVAPIGCHVDLGTFRSDIRKVVADCKAWGVDYVAIPWLSRQDYKTLADWKKLFKEFDGYAKALKKEGLIVQYHNHAFEFQKFGIKNGAGGKTILDMLYEGTRFIQAELDFGWVARGGYDPVTWAKKMKGRLDQVHLKDWGIHDDQLVIREIGEGSLDWPAIIKACKASGTKHFLIEQDNFPMTGDAFKSIAISRANLKKMGL